MTLSLRALESPGASTIAELKCMALRTLVALMKIEATRRDQVFHQLKLLQGVLSSRRSDGSVGLKRNAQQNQGGDCETLLQLALSRYAHVNARQLARLDAGDRKDIYIVTFENHFT